MSRKHNNLNKVGSAVKEFMAVPEFFFGVITLGVVVLALVSTYFNYLR